MRTFTLSFICLSAAITLSACGGSSSGGGTVDETPSVSQDVRALMDEYDTLAPIEFEPAALKRVSGEELETLLKNGLRMRYKPVVYDYPIRTLGPLPTTVDGPTEKTGSASSSSSGGPSDGLSGFSGTTVLVAGVDEADTSKYDGKHWYVMSQRHNQSGINVIATDASTGDMEKANEFVFSDQSLAPQSLYVRVGQDSAEELVVLKQGYLPIDTDDDAPIPTSSPVSTSLIAKPLPYYPQGRSQLALQWLALDGPNIASSDTLKYFGSIVDSRKIGDQLFLVSDYQPELDGLRYPYFPLYRLADGKQEVLDNEKYALSNEKLIEQASLDDLLAGAPQSKTCLVTPSLTEKDAVTNLLWITTIDLTTRKVTQAECVAARSSGIYMGPGGLYIGDTDYRYHQAGWGLPFFDGNQAITALHKFSLDEQGLAYTASGNVQGRLGWQNPALRMSERKGLLRVVTTNGNGSGIEHKLTVFEEKTDAGTLVPVSVLPNKDRPAAIGKPGERIFATRFFGDRAYIVTYLQIDPLYVIDLSDPKDPEITGELEIPGFSTFLQPLGEHLLFAVGNTDDRDVKVELFDVQDIQSPKVVNTFEFQAKEGQHTFSEATHQYKALSFLVDGNKARATLPLSTNGYDPDTQRYISRTSLELFNIEGLELGRPTIDYQGAMDVESSLKAQNRYSSLYSRSVIHDDTVFFVQSFSHKNVTTEAWSASWYTPDSIADTVYFGEQKPEVITIEK